MAGFKFTWCGRCGADSAHDLYTDSNGYLHSMCTNCGRDVSSNSRLDHISGEGTKTCSKCDTNTEHLRYIDSNGYVHWFCCSCGRDISSSARER